MNHASQVWAADSAPTKVRATTNATPSAQVDASTSTTATAPTATHRLREALKRLAGSSAGALATSAAGLGVLWTGLRLTQQIGLRPGSWADIAIAAVTVIASLGGAGVAVLWTTLRRPKADVSQLGTIRKAAEQSGGIAGAIQGAAGFATASSAVPVIASLGPVGALALGALGGWAGYKLGRQLGAWVGKLFGNR